MALDGWIHFANSKAEAIHPTGATFSRLNCLILSLNPQTATSKAWSENSETRPLTFKMAVSKYLDATNRLSARQNQQQPIQNTNWPFVWTSTQYWMLFKKEKKKKKGYLTFSFTFCLFFRVSACLHTAHLMDQRDLRWLFDRGARVLLALLDLF